MSNAVCEPCNGTVSWHARRGTNLKDLRCPNGHANLRPAKAHESYGPKALKKLGWAK